jgi:hypothetical protein
MASSTGTVGHGGGWDNPAVYLRHLDSYCLKGYSVPGMNGDLSAASFLPLTNHKESLFFTPCDKRSRLCLGIGSIAAHKGLPLHLLKRPVHIPAAGRRRLP